MNIKFTKIEGLGNDYIFIDCINQDLSSIDLVAFTKKISDRHFGIGSDGAIFLFLSKRPENDFEYVMRNADGSEAEMCGNGMRGFAKFIYDKGISNKTKLRIETKAGLIIPEIIAYNKDGSVRDVRVDMGEPILNGLKIPSVFDEEKIIDRDFEVEGETFKMNLVSMGNPHFVTFVDKITDEHIFKLGPIIENMTNYFPNKINVEFVEVIDRNNLKMRVWERGTGETLACGTGACAVAVASILNNLIDRKVKIELLGGDLTIEWDEKSNHVFKTGPTTKVFDGSVEY